VRTCGDESVFPDYPSPQGWQGGLRTPRNALPEALYPLGQRLRTPAERRIARRFVSA
jgi:hypothetical protein